MRKALIPFFTVLAMITTVPRTANACRAYQSDDMKMNRAYDAVVIATITKAQYMNASSPMENWQANAVLKQIVEGKDLPNKYTFIDYIAPTACHYGQPIANIGEDWVLYMYRQSGSGNLVVNEAYPFSKARQMDKRFIGIR